MSLVSKVKSSCADVAQRASHVLIREERLAEYARAAQERKAQPSLDPTQSDVGSSRDRVAFVLMRDATNFGSGYHPSVKKLPGRSGARTMGAYLASFVTSEGIPDTDWLRSVQADDCARIFRQEMNGPVGELMGLFAQAWNELGDFLHQRFSGSAMALVEESKHSAVTLVEILVEMQMFRDRATYANSVVHFYKRAQLAGFDLAQTLKMQGVGRFTDLSELTLFADNLIPHVLRVDGVLEYSPELLARVDGGELLPSGCAAEVEIRASAIHAVSELSRLCGERGDEVTALELGDWLWNRGQQQTYKSVARHRTRCVFY